MGRQVSDEEKTVTSRTERHAPGAGTGTTLHGQEQACTRTDERRTTHPRSHTRDTNDRRIVFKGTCRGAHYRFFGRYMHAVLCMRVLLYEPFFH